MGWTAHIASRSLIAVLLTVGLSATGCSSEGLRAGDAATIADGSTAEMAVDGDDWVPAQGGSTVPEGARVRAGKTEVVLQMRNGTARLSPGATAVIQRHQVEVANGEVLIDSDKDLAAAVEDTTVTGTGTFRVTSGLSARVGVYQGSAIVKRPAQEREVTGLRQLDLSAFRLAAAPSPLQYRDSDAWDQQFLGDAITFDGEAARLAGGIDIEVGRAPLRPRFYREFAGRSVLPFLGQAATVTRRGAFGPPSDILMTVFVSRAAPGPLAPAVERVADLRDAGARWGLVAVELDVASEQVVAAIDTLGRNDLAVAARGSSLPERATATGSGRPTGSTTPAGDTTVASNDDTSTGTQNDTGSDNDPTTTPPDNDPGDDPGDDDPTDPTPPDNPDPPDPEDPGLEDVVEDVVTQVGDPSGGGADPEKGPVSGVEVPPLP
jgi:hypothetical protein